MLRKTLTILSLIGLLLSVGLWGVTGRWALGFIPESRTCKIGFMFGAFTFLCPDEPFAELADPRRTQSPSDLTSRMREFVVHIEPSRPYRGFVRVGGDDQARATSGIGSLRLVGWHWRWLPRIEEKLGVFVNPGSPNSYQIDCTGYFLEVPLWIPALVFGSLFCTCLPLTFHRRRNRKKLGLCVKCGYDLRASKDRCPECGEEFGSTNVG